MVTFAAVNAKAETGAWVGGPAFALPPLVVDSTDLRGTDAEAKVLRGGEAPPWSGAKVGRRGGGGGAAFVCSSRAELSKRRGPFGLMFAGLETLVVCSLAAPAPNTPRFCSQVLEDRRLEERRDVRPAARKSPSLV